MLSRSLFLALSLSAGLGAQDDSFFPISLVQTASPVGVHAGPEISALPQGETIIRPIALVANYPDFAFPATAPSNGAGIIAQSQSTLSIAPSSDLASQGASFRWGGFAVNSSRAGTIREPEPVTAPHCYSLGLFSPSGGGTLQVVFEAQREGRARVSARIESGDFALDLPSPIAAPRLAFENFRVGDGRRLKITIFGSADSQGPGDLASYAAGLKIAFEPTPVPPGCTVSPGRPSCPEGGVLRGAVAPDSGQLVLSLQGGLPEAYALALVGRPEASPTIWPSPCILLGRPYVLDIFKTDVMGDGRTALRIPPHAFEAELQVATVDVSGFLRIATSNTLILRCGR